jgi:hypothetical protein
MSGDPPFTSQVPVVTGVLFESLVELVPYGQVLYGNDVRRQAAETVIVGDTVDWTQEPVSLGRQRRGEGFTIELFIDVRAVSQRDATERAFELLAVIELYLRETKNLGLDPQTVLSLGVRPSSESKSYEGDKFRSLLHVGVVVSARI